jgi:hypothetical protein
MPPRGANDFVARGKLGYLLAPMLGLAVTVHTKPADHGR